MPSERPEQAEQQTKAEHYPEDGPCPHPQVSVPLGHTGMVLVDRRRGCSERQFHRANATSA